MLRKRLCCTRQQVLQVLARAEESMVPHRPGKQVRMGIPLARSPAGCAGCAGSPAGWVWRGTRGPLLSERARPPLPVPGGRWAMLRKRLCSTRQQVLQICLCSEESVVPDRPGRQVHLLARTFQTASQKQLWLRLDAS